MRLGMEAHTSFEPRPNPETTFPFIRRGNGASGPESGPIIVGRGPSGRIFSPFSCQSTQRLSEKYLHVLIKRIMLGREWLWWGRGIDKKVEDE